MIERQEGESNGEALGRANREIERLQDEIIDSNNARCNQRFADKQEIERLQAALDLLSRLEDRRTITGG